LEARALLRRALEADPGCAVAYAALAETYHIAVSMGWAESPPEFLARAEDMANKALSLDPGQVRAHVTLGRVHSVLSSIRPCKGRAQNRRSRRIPDDATALAGRGNLLMWLGQTDDAIAALELAKRIDPELKAIDRFALSLAYYLNRRYDAAIAEAELNLRGTAEANFTRIVLAAAYAQRNHGDEAAREAELIRRTDPTFDPAAFGSNLLRQNDLEHLRDGLSQSRTVSRCRGAAAAPEIATSSG
jgi:tetratricopeptide (TPR) repeat protein